MSKLTMCRGLPGSGKSFWSAQQEAVVVNKDDIRKLLESNGWTWSRENEKDVITVRDQRIADALKAGKDVISSDTNFGRHEGRLREIAKVCGANFEIKDFTSIPIEVCIERDAQRDGTARVGEKVIRDMAKKYLENGAEAVRKFEYDPKLPYVIICDLDGTLALKHPERNIYDASTADKDIVNEPVRYVLNISHWSGGTDIIYVSGREDKYRKSTEVFLHNNSCPPGKLLMRKTGDMRNDSIVKKEIYEAEIMGKYNVRFCLDDRDRVVKTWRELGLTCFQVAEGNF